MRRFLHILFTATFTCILIFPSSALSQTSYTTLQVILQDTRSSEPLEYATFRILQDGKQLRGGVTNSHGTLRLENLMPGNYSWEASYLGYVSRRGNVTLPCDTTFVCKLQEEVHRLKEVVITASENKEAGTASTINKDAMKHLQPSSFTDLLELLPGGVSKDPALKSPNQIQLREAGNPGDNYAVSALGTAFMIDDAPVSVQGNLQYVQGSSSSTLSGGLDMRSLATDQIESVEIVRGIPSVAYGNLSSGLVRILRKQGEQPLNARFKADLFGKLFSVGKGVRLSEHFTLNSDLGYLDSQNDPRNNLEVFRRINGSLRLQGIFNTPLYRFQWNTGVDYDGTLDNQKSDPDLTYNREEKYSAAYNRLAWNNRIRWDQFRNPFLQSFELNAGSSLQLDRIEQTKYVSLNQPVAVPTQLVPGEQDVDYLPYQYIAEHITDGKPLALYLRGNAEFKANHGWISHRIRTGFEWNFDKNLGEGQVYDLSRPLNPTVRSRPRRYADIPAMQRLAFYAEDVIEMRMGNHQLRLTPGFRSAQMPGLSSRYEMQGKIWIDPRINIVWQLPRFSMGGRPVRIDLSAGAGQHTLMPTLAQLYPDPLYYDIVQLNYFHPESTYRRLNVRTYVTDRVNYELEPAHNLKWEIGTSINWGENRFSLTAFREDMKNGFRDRTLYQSMEYKDYDELSVDAAALTGKPALEDFSWSPDTLLATFTQAGNGTRILKRGIEYQFMSARMPALKTRLTINGAWFRTLYSNSREEYKDPNVVINGKKLKYLGVYAQTEGYEKEQFNTNFIFDTWLEKLGLGFSTSAQCMWYTGTRTLPKSGVPVRYVDTAGNEYPYTEASAQDKLLQWLTLSYSESNFVRTVVPISVAVNLKATKRFGNYVDLALFVNRLLDYNPSYTLNGKLIRRSVDPYFGMELNIKL